MERRRESVMQKMGGGAFLVRPAVVLSVRGAWLLLRAMADEAARAPRYESRPAVAKKIWMRGEYNLLCSLI